MEAANPSRHIVSFGAFEADLPARELRKRGLKIRLQDQPFQVLTILLERPGELVTREGSTECYGPRISSSILTIA